MTLVVPEPERPVSALAEPPSFSIVIPAYQGAWCVADAVASVLDQRTPAHQVLACDDGSTDDLAGALAPFAGRVTVLHQRHAGVVAARNLGLAHARGASSPSATPTTASCPACSRRGRRSPRAGPTSTSWGAPRTSNEAAPSSG